MADPTRVILAALLAAPLVPAQGHGGRIAARVEAYLAPLADMDLFSGTVLIARRGEVVVHQAWGMADGKLKLPNTVDTRFHLAAVSETVTGVMVMRLVQDGKLALTDPVGKHLPDWPDAWSAVTVHHLLDHTSGIPDQEREWWMHEAGSNVRGLELWRSFAAGLGMPLQQAPGTRSSASRFDTVLAGCVAEAATGQGYRRLARANVLQPAGMQDTGFDDGAAHDGLAVGCRLGMDGRPEPGRDLSPTEAAGGLWSTAADLYRFDRALRGDDLLNGASRERMFTARVGNSACSWLREPLHGQDCIHHSGGHDLYSLADFLRFPDDDACIVVLCNHAWVPIQQISRDLAAILFGVEYQPPVRTERPFLDACAGVYQWPGGKGYTIARRLGRLLFSYDVWQDVCSVQLLLPLGNGTFAVTEAGDWRDSLRPAAAALLSFEPAAEPPRIRTTAKQREMILTSTPPPFADWSALAGELQVQQTGGKAELAVDGDRLWLEMQGGRPERWELVPVDAKLAMLLSNPVSDVVLHREGKVLRWQRGDGEVRLERK
jgi:CubicO group peptidase (beta-lactamase class C family)